MFSQAKSEVMDGSSTPTTGEKVLGELYVEKDGCPLYAVLCLTTIKKDPVNTFVIIQVRRIGPKETYFCLSQTGNCVGKDPEVMVEWTERGKPKSVRLESLGPAFEGALIDGGHCDLSNAKTVFSGLFHQWTNNYWDVVRLHPEAFWHFKGFHRLVDTYPPVASLNHPSSEAFLTQLRQGQPATRLGASLDCPLGSLTPRQIRLGMEALETLSFLTDRQELSAHYYSIIPHVFPCNPPVLKTEQMIQQQIELLVRLNGNQPLWPPLPKRHRDMAGRHPNAVLVVDRDNAVWAAEKLLRNGKADANVVVSLQLLQLNSGLFICSQQIDTASAKGIIPSRKIITFSMDDESMETNISTVEDHHLSLGAAKESFCKLFRYYYTNLNWYDVKGPRQFRGSEQ